MSIPFDILGRPGDDNAVWARVETGTATHRLLFDCGDGCAAAVGAAELMAVEHLFFSHYHMDHVAGFDTFFRCNYNRGIAGGAAGGSGGAAAQTVNVWGPPGSADILHHRFRGYTWNLHANQPGVWRVHDIHRDRVEAFEFLTREAFAVRHPAGAVPFDPATGLLIDQADFTVAAKALHHGTTSMAYLVREKPRSNVDAGKLPALGLRPGPWLKRVKDPATLDTETVDVAGSPRPVGELRRLLVSERPGDSLAYVTDFRVDEEETPDDSAPLAASRLPVADRAGGDKEATAQPKLPLPGDPSEAGLARWLAGCGTLICEAQYRDADERLARANRHMTAPRVARLAKRAGVRDLVLFHLSDRYPRDEWDDLLAEAKAVFPATRFPASWVMGAEGE